MNNSQGSPTWREGIVTKITAPLSYKVKLYDGSIIRRHIDHICFRHSSPQQHISTKVDDSFTLPQHQPTSTLPNGTAETTSQQPPTAVLRRSTCVRHPLNHFP